MTDSGNTNLTSLQKFFSEAAGSKQRELKVNVENLTKLQEEIIIKENIAVMPEVKERKEEEQKRTIIYRTYNNRAHKIDWFLEKKIEMSLKPILERVEMMERGKVYSSVEVVFYKAEEAKKLSYKPLKTEEINFMPLYMGCRMARLRVRKIPKREDPLRVVATVLKPIMERMDVIKA